MHIKAPGKKTRLLINISHRYSLTVVDITCIKTNLVKRLENQLVFAYFQ